MLFISILLSVWFVLWLAKSVFMKDIAKLFVSWMEMFTEDDEDIDQLLEKAEDNCVYHLNCEHCNHDWWAIEPSVNYCPNCGKKLDN